MKTKIGYFILGLALVFTLSCSKYPPSSERLLEDLAVFTQYDTSARFSNYQTYSLPAGIVKITARDTNLITDANATAVIAQVRKNMNARGYTEVTLNQNPDLGFQVVYYQNTNVYAYYGGYYGYDWWGYYYPYYPVYYSSYTTGLADIQLIDLKILPPNHQQRYLRWNGFVRGILNGSHTADEILGSIDQAFSQTPQIHK